MTILVASLFIFYLLSVYVCMHVAAVTVGVYNCESRDLEICYEKDADKREVHATSAAAAAVKRAYICVCSICQ